MRPVINLIRALLMLPLLAAPSPLFAAEYADSAALDELFAQLRVAHDANEANDITHQIWQYWLTPDVADLATRMQTVGTAQTVGDLPAALIILTGVTRDYPDYAEGWNQRATLYYMLGNFDASLADIEKVLALEPRHFGALSGRVMIYLKQGKRAEALKDMVAALAIDPYLSEKELFPELAQNVTHV
jgi:tetratricopeptide (TPR) repeat protein